MTGRFMRAAKSAYEYKLLIGQLWHTPLMQAPDQVIVYRDIKRFTYRELRERIGRLASGLGGLGVNAGDAVGVLDWDSNRYLEAYFAVPMMGAVLQTVNVRHTPDQIAQTINHAGSSVLLANDEFVPMLEGIRDKLPLVKRLVVISDRAAPQVGRITFDGEYEDLLRAASPDYNFSDFDENTVATTFYTTGTTGAPKGVCFTHRQLVLHTLAEMAFLGTAAKQGRFCHDDVYMPITPMFHAHAWGLPWTATLSGVKQVYPGRYDPAFLLKLIKTEGVTFTHAVPTILRMLLDAATTANTDLAGLKMVIGGSELPKGLARQALALGVDVFAGYGMSESAPLLCMAQVKSSDLIGDPEKALDIRTKAGMAAPLVDIRLLDTQLNEIPHDGKTSGEIVVRAPWLTQSYVDNEEASERLWAGGFLHTDDIGIIESGGSLRIVDRIKDVIKTGGEWVSSAQIEDLISQCDGVSEVAVVGVKDDKWGERPLALVVRDAQTGGDLDDTRIKGYLTAQANRGMISKYGIPDKILFVRALPRTSVGKFNKNELREKYGKPG